MTHCINEKIIKDFLKEMATQDNRATAFPYFYVIRDRGKVSADSGDFDVVEYIAKDDFEDVISKEKYNELKESEQDKYYANYTQYVVEEKGMFLTEKDAEEHLRLNSHHYSKDAHTYVKSAWRADYLKEFLTALFNYFGQEGYLK